MEIKTLKWADSFCCIFRKNSVKIKHTEFFWSVFSCIWTEYADLLRKSPYSVPILENTEQNKLRIWTVFTQWVTLNHGCIS